MLADKNRTNILEGVRGWPWYTRFARDPLSCLVNIHKEHGSVSALGTPFPFRRRRRRKFILAFGPENNRRILGDAETFSPGSVSVRGPQGSALNRIRKGFNEPRGTQKKPLRKSVMPAFQKKAVQEYQPDIVAITNELIEQWSCGQSVEMWEQMRSLSGNLACKLLFGRESLADSRSLGESLQKFMQASYLSPAFLLTLNLPGTPYRTLVQRAENVADTIQKMLDKRQTSISSRTDVLEMLVRAYQTNSDSEHIPDLLGPAAFLFVASFETVANAMTWTLFLLAQHPQIMAELYAELNQVLAGEAPTISELDQLPFLDATIKESMRILPPVPITYRVARQETELEGVVVHSGDRVLCSQYVTQHMPEIFSEPNRFDPQRWFSIQPSVYEYFPFGAGPRCCVGYTLGMTTIKISLAMILQSFRLSVTPKTRVDRLVKLTMSPRRGLSMRIHQQDRKFEAVPVSGNIHEMVDLTQLNLSHSFFPQHKYGKSQFPRGASAERDAA